MFHKTIPYCRSAYIVTLSLTLNPGGKMKGTKRLYLSNEVIQMPHVLVLVWTNFDISLDSVRLQYCSAMGTRTEPLTMCLLTIFMLRVGNFLFWLTHHVHLVSHPVRTHHQMLTPPRPFILFLNQVHAFKTQRSPISPLSCSRLHHPRPVARTRTQMHSTTRTSYSQS